MASTPRAAPTSHERVRVYARIKPASDREFRAGISCTRTGDGTVGLAARESVGAKELTYDGVYGPEADQQGVYDEVGAPILDAVMQGYNGTVLAYGQTGTGKTHTLLNVGQGPADAGLVPRLVAALFVSIKCDVRHVYAVRASFAQIYNEQIDDLLSLKNTNGMGRGRAPPRPLSSSVPSPSRLSHASRDTATKMRGRQWQRERRRHWRRHVAHFFSA
jgi:hypothetical protein